MRVNKCKGINCINKIVYQKDARANPFSYVQIQTLKFSELHF